MNKIADFLAALNEIQEEYGLYIVTPYEEEIYVSLDRSSSNHQIVCMTGNNTIMDLDDEKVQFDPVNFRKVSDDA